MDKIEYPDYYQVYTDHIGEHLGFNQNYYAKNNGDYSGNYPEIGTEKR